MPADRSRPWVPPLVAAGAVFVGTVLWVTLPYRVYILGEPVQCHRGPVFTYLSPRPGDLISGCYGEAHHRLVESGPLFLVFIALMVLTLIIDGHHRYRA